MALITFNRIGREIRTRGKISVEITTHVNYPASGADRELYTFPERSILVSSVPRGTDYKREEAYYGSID